MKTNIKNKLQKISKKTIAIVSGVILTLILLLFVFLKQSKANVLLKVGNEKIYRKDYQKVSQLTVKGQSIEDKLSRKFVRESILLQAGAKENLVELDKSVFNSKNKDLKKRAQLAYQVEKIVKDNTIAIEGEYVAIWFDNVEVGPLGYDEAKKRAYRKIKFLHDQVKSGSMTMAEAGENIKNDEKLALIDKAYKKNAYIEFKNMLNERISFSPEFNQAMWNLEEGEISVIVAAKDKTLDRGLTEAIYLFGKVNKKKEPKYISFAAWYNQAREEYSIEKFY